MSAAAAIPLVPDSVAPGDKPGRFGRLVDLVRKLIDYGKELATTLQQRTTNDLAAVTRPFGTGDIVLILARITRGLLRASALEARVVELAAAAHPDAATQASARTGPTCTARASAGSRQARRGGQPSPCPSAHAGADRRRGPPSAGRRGHC